MDSARRTTDQQISAMRREFAADYDQLGGSMSARLAEYLADFVDDEGNVEATALAGRRWARMRDQLARECTDLNSESMRTLDGRLGEVRQMTAEGSPVQSAVPHPTIDQRVDVAWNRRKVEAAARGGIGRTPAEAGERMRRVADMNSNATARRVRTAVNGAENAGRMDAMLARGGSKRWVTVQDERVRDSHAALHGKVVPVDEPFGNGLMFPGDPSGPPEEVYNCRCSIEWVDTADSQPEELPQEWEMAEGQDMLGTWQRRPDEYDFEIEDVMAAQGFDGKPRIVDADEFDRAVRQANGGDGLIMQRTYSAPDQATLDAYRESLYDGKWYVDCSTGGSQYGQGMYCAADWSGNLSDGIRQEMSHYQTIGKQRIPSTPYSADEVTDYVRGWMRENADGIDGDAKANAEKYATGMYRLWNDPPSDRKARRALSRAVDDAEDEIPDSVLDRINRELMPTIEKLRHEPVSYTETMTLDPSARVIKLKDVTKEMEENWEPSMPEDVGSYAAAMGYDAIDAVGHGKSESYTVVLNRTKLIIRRPE